MSKRLAKNSIAAGLTTLLVTTGMSFAANGADGDTFEARAEAQFISAGDAALGNFLETVADQIEGVEIECLPATPTADCTKTQASDALLSLPIAAPTGIELGAANNFATGDSADGSSKAASGAVTDSGTVNTDAPGAAPSNLSIDLDAGQLSPIANAVANAKIDLGAIGSSAALTSPSATPTYDYSIAGGTLTLDLPALKTLFDQIETVYGTAVADVGDLSLDDICAAAGLGVVCDTLGIDLEVEFPTLDELFDGVAAETRNGIAVDLKAGTVSVDLAQALEKEINQANFPATATGTDILPLVTADVDTAVSQVVASLTDSVNGIVPQILAKSKITLTTPAIPLVPAIPGLPGIPGVPEVPAIPAQEIVLSAAQLGAVLQPVLDDLTDGLADITDGLVDATPDLSAGLAQILELRVGVTGLADETLVGDGAAAAAAGDTYSVTALQVKVLQAAPAADLRLATSVVGPNDDAVVDADDDGDNAATTDGTNADTNDDGNAATAGDGSNADSNADSNSISDADSAADADASASLPDAGAPNLLPFFLLGIALLAFGLAVLLNERRRLGSLGPDSLV